VRRGLALIALVVLACDDRGGGHVERGPERASAQAAARLDPSHYRAEIEAVEAVLYARSPVQPDDGERTSYAVESLLASISKREGALPAGHPALGLREFGAHQLAAGAAGGPASDRSPAQSEWEVVRDRAFARASWFSTSSVEYVESQAAQPRRLDRTSVARLTQMLERLRALADVGERECDVLGTPVPAAAGSTARPVASGDEVARWQEFQRSWLERVDAAARELPSAEPAAPRDFALAIERTGAALRELRDAPAGVGRAPTPVPGQWQPRFAAARSEIAKAREYLARLP